VLAAIEPVASGMKELLGALVRVATQPSTHLRNNPNVSAFHAAKEDARTRLPRADRAISAAGYRKRAFPDAVPTLRVRPPKNSLTPQLMSATTAR
jgi:hypothetical protein